MTAKIKIITLFSLFVFLLIPAAVLAAPDPTAGPGGAPGSDGTSSGELTDNPIVKDINLIVNFLSVGVGIVVVGMLIMGGVQYSLAGDKPEAVNAAKQRITNALIALFAYLFLFAFVQWLVPGGVF